MAHGASPSSQASNMGEDNVVLSTLLDRMEHMTRELSTNMGELRRDVNTRLDQVEGRMDTMEVQPPIPPMRNQIPQRGRGRGHQPRAQPRRRDYHERHEEVESVNEEEFNEYYGEERPRRPRREEAFDEYHVDERPRRPRRDEEVDGNLGSIKLTVPPFYGGDDPNAYLDWERRVESIFECHRYSEEKKIKLADRDQGTYLACLLSIHGTNMEDEVHGAKHYHMNLHFKIKRTTMPIKGANYKEPKHRKEGTWLEWKWKNRLEFLPSCFADLLWPNFTLLFEDF